MNKAHKEEAYAVLMYPRSERPYFAIGPSGLLSSHTPVLFLNTAAALAWRQGIGVVRQSRTVAVKIQELTQ